MAKGFAVIVNVPKYTDNTLPLIKTEDNWKHSSKNMTCITCMWYVEKTRTSISEVIQIGRCRRHSPTMDGFPVVIESDWCGDHKIDETKI